MADYKHLYPIEKMSKVFRVSRSGYYRWFTGQPSPRVLENQRLKKKMLQIWNDSKKKYGSPRIHQQLLRQGYKTSRPRVARLMQKMGIASRIRRKWITTTDSKHDRPVAANLLDRRFSPCHLGQVWVSDITYIPSEQGWLYLATVMDLADRQILGWSLSKNMSAGQTSVAAFKQACLRRPIGRDLIFHSDRGIQYACEEFVKLLNPGKRITQSMSRKGNCWDNAPAESFFKTLKAELEIPGKYRDYQQARQAIFEFIEIWYNRKRLHSGLGYRTPAEVEIQLSHKQAA